MGYGRDSRNEGLGVRDKRIGVREEWLGRRGDGQRRGHTDCAN